MHALHEYQKTSEVEWRGMSVEVSARWRNLVSQYSERVLSFYLDVLPAISGFAKIWQARRENPTQYVAGLWEDELQRGVLWKAGASYDSSRPERYLAPSWSWACIRRSVTWFSSNYLPRYHVDILDVSCDLKYPSNPYGPVTAGHLTVKGLVLRTSLEMYRHEKWPSSTPNILKIRLPEPTRD